MFDSRELHNIAVGIAEMESAHSEDTDKDIAIVNAIDGAVDALRRLSNLLLTEEA